MRDASAAIKLLKDYRPPEFLIDTVDLEVEIRDDYVLVKARLGARRNPKAQDQQAPLVLDGDELQLQSVAIDGHALSTEDYQCDTTSLQIAKVPRQFSLETVSRIDPWNNTQLMGFFASKDGLFTQCEAEGFRRITWFIDRPDVMSRYNVTLRADRARFPMLLANGNLVDSGSEANDRHWARWQDPFPKPCYLFAMVAAKLDLLEDTFTTLSGRHVKLGIYVEPGKIDQSQFAMQALKKSMKWDEDVFGLEVDLDRYMIVAVGDFNMGAMENKGLNIFNTKYVLARADTATDSDFMNVDRVIAHEYFHNWTGNRVTCRDWFQLSLKEGLTVFRDQEYGADMYSRPVQRIQEVRGLRAGQFPEDAGPMAHPVRPQSYLEISNFYTATVYEKGAEVVRMIHTLIGAEAFRKGMDLYFQRHDGQAVTCDEFAQAMQDASGVDLTQFKRWYDQAGTPCIHATTVYDAQKKRFSLTLRQSCPPTPDQTQKQPFHIPVSVGLLDEAGRDLSLKLSGEQESTTTTRTLSLTQAEQTFEFVDVAAKPVPSLLRGFSAPVVLEYDYSETELTHLMAHDSDAFNRFEAAQRLGLGIILRGIDARQRNKAFETPRAFIGAFAQLLQDAGADPAFAAEALSLPSEQYVGEQLAVVDPDAIHAVRVRTRQAIAQELRDALLKTYRSMAVSGRYTPDAPAAGRRALRNLCLSYLMELDDDEVRAICMGQFRGADNMTDAIAALGALANTECDERREALSTFYDRWKNEALVLDKWFSVQATARLPGTLTEVRLLTQHPDFDIRNPNRVRSLISAFAYSNQVRFHGSDGQGYAFIADYVVQLDALNPQVAARLSRAYDRWKKFDPVRQANARAALERIRGASSLSKDVTEVVTRALA